MKFMRYLYEDTRTLYDVFRRGARVSSIFTFPNRQRPSICQANPLTCPDIDNGPCLGWREDPTKQYQWMRYEETLLRAQNLGSGLVALGLKPTPDTLVGVYGQNSPEWVLSEYALYSFSMVIVPLYDTLGPEACNYIINQGINTLVMIVLSVFCLFSTQHNTSYM